MCNMKAPIIKHRTGAREGEKVLRLSALCKQPDAEVVRDLMITYVTGSRLQAGWPSCDERLSALTALAVVLLLLHTPSYEGEKKVLAPLYAAGVEAARIARLRQKWKPGHPAATF
jgi:hypothetical protein